MTERELAGAAAGLVDHADGVFTDSELVGLPDPVASYFHRSVAQGTPLARTARIRMHGKIKIGRWVPFHAHEVLNPHRGFVWRARAAGVISGSDRFIDGAGAMDWRLFGVVPVMRAAGPDTSRSAAGRAAAEAVWIPTSLLPRFGVEWSTVGDDQLRARFHIADHPVQLDLGLTPQRSVRSVLFQRWGDPDGNGSFGLHAFGGEFIDHGTFEGITIPIEGHLGWHFATDRWPESAFFRFRIEEMELVTDGRH